ncbi:DNA/RNA polymerase [Sodiomyces alkalinus F11]|uniref:DNA/RNA polymerase n=1 Tax=Sodiomyces alkalinus (strain CBS 110278 / VKM F-3762 / F11) TaxID=1314773 RepID=A0A3N2Q9U4_SODAK|nr:DNA/RNA polymerase [Sodiomyces alkalinus F11]ROT43415.1 DNA/RNA polymerase [Sodiomyces alkalinus F11]
MERPSGKTTVVLHFDYDCFYASVFENQNPALQSLPLGVKQKGILATCNYAARARGECPELVIVEGEDLTPFRDTSKKLFSFLRSHSWNQKVERLGLDEVFMDVTDIINYNVPLLNRSCLSDSFFCLSQENPESGFPCDLTRLAGCVHGSLPEPPPLENPLYVRLLLGSHLAWYLRLQLEERFGFTSSCGISMNKLLSKLAGSKHKPRNQTTLLSLNDAVVLDFVDSHNIRKIPGIGAKTTRLLEQRILSENTRVDVRVHPDISPYGLETLLGGPGSEQGAGLRVWHLLHGVDDIEVKEASDFPTQISIEDTYRGLNSLTRIEEELRKLSASLVRRMRVDLLTVHESAEHGASDQRWMAHPKTLRLSIRSWPAKAETSDWDFSRTSRSQPLPNFVLSLKESVETIAERLTSDTLFPMLKKLHPEKGHIWDLQLINVCVANMIPSGSQAGTSVGRDISIMFKRQDDVLRQWRCQLIYGIMI